VVTLCLLPVMCIGQRAAAQQTPDAPVVSPHGTADGCTQCHKQQADGRMAPIAPTEVTSLCVSCHDGVKAPADRHPVGRPFDPAAYHVPDDWPTPDNRLSCLTCHEVKLGCDLSTLHGQGQPAHPTAKEHAENPYRLRGGPVTDSMTYCSKCHPAEERSHRYNPHMMLTADGQRNETACLFCHEPGALNANVSRRTGNAHLRQDEVSQCLGCHGSHRDYFDPGHVLAPVAPVMRERIARADPPLPLTADRITCATCHNPHQTGMFPTSAGLDAGGRTSDSTGQPLPLRGYRNSICGVCHGR
jgi:hypothetical protein